MSGANLLDTADHHGQLRQRHGDVVEEDLAASLEGRIRETARRTEQLRFRFIL